jgi:hypothetical protein
MKKVTRSIIFIKDYKNEVSGIVIVRLIGIGAINIG